MTQKRSTLLQIATQYAASSLCEVVSLFVSVHDNETETVSLVNLDHS